MGNFDVEGIAISGVALVWLIPRLIEFAKKIGLRGTGKIWAVVFACGVAFAGVAAAIGENLIPALALPWIRVVALALAGGVAACGAIGEYELGKARNG